MSVLPQTTLIADSLWIMSSALIEWTSLEQLTWTWRRLTVPGLDVLLDKGY